MKSKKGNYGYVKAEKVRRGVMTVIGFALPIALFLFGLITLQTRANLFTVIAIVGCLPACQSLVGFIMMMREKPMDPQLYEEIKPHTGELEMAYEAIVTKEEGRLMLDAVAIAGNEVIALATHPERHDFLYKFEDHLTKNLRADGYHVHVKIFEHKKAFIERLDTLSGKMIDPETISDPDEGSRLTYEHRIREHLLGLCL